MSGSIKKALWLASLFGALVNASWAEDIDIYTTGSTASAAPNVLFFIDNTSNWTANNQAWRKGDVLDKCGSDAECRRYVDLVFGSTTPLSTTLEQGRIELRALKAVLQELVCGAGAQFNVNFGLMLLANTNGTVDGSNITPGYIRRAIRPGADACANVLADLTLIDAKINDPDFKTSNSADYGTALFDAFKYFGGYANVNGIEATEPGSPQQARGFGQTRYSLPNSFEDPGAFTDSNKAIYKSPIAEDHCGQNYIVLIGNGHPSQEYGSNTNATPPSNQLMDYLGLRPQQLYSVANKSDIRFADEWAQFMARTDVNSVPGQQTVKTYTINVFNKQEDTKQTALLNSMAQHGGTGVGGAFMVGGDLKKLIDAFKKILIQISSVNSAFASAALPISTNTQGTYLNQVFIGTFRPDIRPRWWGNLKQYEFALRTTSIDGVTKRDLFLADADGEPAVDNVTTGFLRDCARSFWTTSSGNYWESVPGATPSRCAVITGLPHSDSPDGPLVERGAVAQKIRSTTPGSRTIRTCAAAPSNCSGLATMSVSTDLEKWIRGDNVGDGPKDSEGNYQTYGGAATKPMRPSVHGGVVHSRPLALSYGSGESDVVVFYGADDGLLRAIDGSKTSATGGQELWAFLAPEFKAKMERLRENQPEIRFETNKTDDSVRPKDYFFDGSIGAYIGPDPDDATKRVTYIYPAMRRGGRMIYAFNASAHPRSSPPEPMWRFGCPSDTNDNCVGGADTAKLGQTWSTPRVIRVKNPTVSDPSAINLYTVFGAGYDACEDAEPRNCTADSRGRGVFVLDVKTGTQQRYIDLGSSAGRVVADVVPLDVNGDGLTDLLYIVDTAGNLWRLNVEGRAPSSWALTRVATVADWASQNQRNRKFLYAPAVVRMGQYNVVLAGTGDREKPLYNRSSTVVDAARVKNRFYGFWDDFALTGIDFTLINDGSDCDSPGDLSASGCQVMNTSDTSLDYNGVFSNSLTRPRGWVIDLDDTTSNGPNEQVVTQPAVIGGQVFFSTFQATKPGATGRVCSALGTARGYSSCFLHGGAICSSPAPGVDLTRSSEFIGGGIPPSPVAGMVQIETRTGDTTKKTTVPFCIGCGGGEAVSSGGGNGDDGDGNSGGAPKGPAICGSGRAFNDAGECIIPTAKNRTKVYRYKVID